MLRVLTVAIGTLIVGLLFGVVAGQHINRLPDDPRLATYIAVQSQHLPTMVTDDRRLDEITVGPGLTINYKYTWVRMSESDYKFLSPNYKVEIDQEGPYHLADCKSDPEAALLKSGVTIVKTFWSSDGTLLRRSTVTPYDCGIASPKG